MSLPVQVFFFGIVALVPPGQSGDPYMALLPATTGGQYTSDGCHLGEHEVMMIVDAATCTRTDTNTACDTVGDAAPDLKGRVPPYYFYVSLKKKDLAVDLPATASAPPPARTRYGMVPGSQDEARDLHWLPSFHGMNKVNPDCTAPDGAQKTCPITARVRLKNAVPETCHLIEEEKDRLVCSYRFRPDHESWPFGEPVQAIADGASFSFMAPAALVRLPLVDLFGAGASYLELTSAGAGGVKIWIANIDLSPRHRGDTCPFVPRGRHFEMYYNLLALDGQGLPLPLDERLTPAEEAECGDAVALQPKKQCGGVLEHGRAYPRMSFPGTLIDISACGHAGLMMLTPQ
jgi:hypothetical protein